MASSSLGKDGYFNKLEVDKLNVNKLKVNKLNSCSCCDNIINNQEELKNTKAIALTCIDFRIIDDTVCQMNKLGYLNDYDQFILAGSSLGYNNILSGSEHWIKVANQHIDIAINLHDIEQIILIDHFDCGAYKIAYGSDRYKQNSLKFHTDNLNKAEKKLNTLYPNLSIKKFLISADGVNFTQIN